MADIVKEIYNGTILFGNYTDSLQTLATTGANTTLVVKDVEIGTNGYTTAPNLQIGNFNVGTLNGNLSGSEIIGTNSVLKIKNNQSSSLSNLAVKYFLNVSSTPNYYPQTNPSDLLIGTPTAQTVTQGSATTIPGGTLNGSTQIRFAYTINGYVYYFYWDGNSVTYFYRRNASTGSDELLSSDSYTPICFDGANTFYWFNSSGSLLKFNTTVGSTQTVASYVASGGTTYPSIWYANGVVFWKYYYNTSSIFWYNTTTNTYGYFSDPSGWYSSNNSYTCVFYDSTTYMYRFVVTAGGGLNATSYQYIDILGNSTGTSFSYATSGSLSSSKQINLFQNTVVGMYNYTFGSNSDSTNNSIYRFDKTMTVTKVGTITDATFGNYTRGFITTSAATTEQLNTYGPQISLRITGVESTI